MSNFPSVFPNQANNGNSGNVDIPLIEMMLPDTMVAWSGYEPSISSGVHKFPCQYVICDNWNTVDINGGYVSHTDEQLDVTILLHVSNGKSKGGQLKVAIWSEHKKEKELVVTLPNIGLPLDAYRFQFRGNAIKGETYYATYEFSNPPTGFLAPYHTFVSVDAIGKSGAYRSAIGMFDISNTLPIAGTEIITSRDSNTNALRVKARESHKDIINVTE